MSAQVSAQTLLVEEVPEPCGRAALAAGEEREQWTFQQRKILPALVHLLAVVHDDPCPGALGSRGTHRATQAPVELPGGVVVPRRKGGRSDHERPQPWAKSCLIDADHELHRHVPHADEEKGSCCIPGRASC